MRYKVFFLLFLCLFLTGCKAQHSNFDNETMLQRQEDIFNEKITSRLKSQIDPLKNAVLSFSDPFIEAETRKILNKPEGDILIRDVLTITALDFWGNISTLKDLKWFTNLESITLRYCDIKNLEGIENLINLKKLDVGYNNISNLDTIGLDYVIANQSVTINSNMPEFGIETLSYFEDDLYKVQTLTVINNSTGENLQTILIPEISKYGDTEITKWHNNILEFKDLSFDGYIDIVLLDSNNSTYQTSFIYLLWNPELGLYQNDKLLSSIPGISFDEEEQLIYGFSSSEEYNTYYTYQYIEGELTLMVRYKESNLK